ncbi:MAG: TRAP transporter small permease [Spirochaetales bacterium]|nr:TRAP transporter small permease [Spirochaetales bacterium]
MNRFLKIVTVIDRFLGRLMKGVSILCMAVLLILLAGNVFVRFVPIMSFHWFDEIVRWAFAWLVFFGAAALWRENEHFRIQWLQVKLEGTIAGNILALVLEFLSLFFFIVLTYFGMWHTIRATQWTPIFNLSVRWMYVCVPINGFFMVIYSLRNVISQICLFRKKTDRKQE